MKGVILAGGKGLRLYPLTKATNKHLLPVGREPMIYHCIRQLCSAGITEILVVTSTDHMGDVVRCLGSGTEFDCTLSYKVQEKAGGIAHALMLAEDFSSDGRICVILGDNIFQYSIAPYAEGFREQTEGARVLLKEVSQPQHYGVAALDEHHVIEIEEKPQAPKSNYAVLGLYFYDSSVFDHIRQTEPSSRGELEITAVNNRYIDAGLLQYDICYGEWTDAGKFESYHDANRIMHAQANRILIREDFE